MVLALASDQGRAVIRDVAVASIVQHLSVMVNALHEAYLGTKELMNNGTNTYLEVLKAQEDLLTAQLREVENHNDGVQALINLYIALGGAVE